MMEGKSQGQKGQGGRLVAVDCDELIRRVVVLAGQVWREHYPALIGEEQVEYMLDEFQSFAAIREQIDEGMEYFLLSNNGEDAGYFAVQVEGEGLFLSKLYVKRSQAGKGLGGQMLEFVREHWRPERVRLTVNKGNLDSIRFYQHHGFSKTGEVVLDIGDGFVMDDFEMEWRRKG